MGLFDHFPYTNVHELNLDWILIMMKALEAEWEAFTAGNSLTFADPMLHDVTKTYAKNTIVLDGNGNAYVSLQAVPVGVGLQNGDYWLMVFDYEAFIEKVNKNFTARYYRGSYRATSAMAIGDWLTVDDILYKATAAIAVDDVLEDGVNITHFTLEDFIKAFMQSANQLIQQYKNDIDASELLYRQQLAQDIANTTASLQSQLNLAISGATVDSEVINARLGANGVTYSTLGEAIRTQFTLTWAAIINQSLASGADLNDIVATGIYRLSGSGTYDNCPIASGRRLIIVTSQSLAGSAIGGTYQILIDCTDGETYCRALANSTWDAWQRINNADLTDLESATAANTLNITNLNGAVINQSLASGADLNDIVAIGQYRLAGSGTYANCPIPSGRRLLIVSSQSIAGSAIGGTYQMLINCSDGQTFCRALANSIWEDWYEIQSSFSQKRVSGINPSRKCLDHGGIYQNTIYGSNSIYQNSPLAFLTAEKLGIHYHNLDIVFSSDYVPFVYHNFNVTDINGVSYNINNMTAADVANIVMGDGNYTFNIYTLADMYKYIRNLGGSVDMVDATTVPGIFANECATKLGEYYFSHNLRIAWTNFDTNQQRRNFMSAAPSECGLYFVLNSSATMTNALLLMNNEPGHKYCVNVSYSNATVASAFDAVASQFFAYQIPIYVYTYNASNYQNVPYFADGIISENININYELSKLNNVL